MKIERAMKLTLSYRLKLTYWHYRSKIIQKIHIFFIKKLHLPICHGQEGPCFHLGKKRRQNAAYHNDKLNWVFLCDKCMKINHEYWKEMWSEYYYDKL